MTELNSLDTPAEIGHEYTLQEIIGKGSYGTVYEATDTEGDEK